MGKLRSGRDECRNASLSVDYSILDQTAATKRTSSVVLRDLRRINTIPTIQN
jgi:hypothetical protein